MCANGRRPSRDQRKGARCAGLHSSPAVLVLTGALVAGISAATMKTINGTARNDVSLGDAWPGHTERQGRQRQAARQGRQRHPDRRSGQRSRRRRAGPRPTRLRAGRDTAIADTADTVGGDCEVVKGLAQRGVHLRLRLRRQRHLHRRRRRQGRPLLRVHQSGQSICFDTTGTSVARFETTSDLDCGIGILQDIGLSFGGSTKIQSDLSFSFAYDGPLETGSGSPITNVTTSYAVSGKFDTAGNAAGTLNVNRFSFDYQGTHYNCAAAGYGWQAKVGA